MESIRVLIVEDSPTQQLVLSAMLEELSSLTIEVAETLQEALAKLRMGLPDVVTLDLTLPDASELQALEAIHARYPELSVIVVTGTEVSLEGPARQAGARDYLEKATLTAEQFKKAMRAATVKGLVTVAAEARKETTADE